MEARYFIEGEIGWEVTLAKIDAFIEENKAADSFRFVIDSPGGSVEVGTNIYDRIRAIDKPVFTEVFSAHSIASIFPLATPLANREIHENGGHLIHLPWGGMVGNAEEMEAAGAKLREAEAQILGIYARGTGQNEAALSDIMSEERVIGAPEAVELGFAGKILLGTKARKTREFKAVAYLNKRNEREEEMKILTEIKALLDTMKPEVKALFIAMDSGQTLEVVTNETVAKIGDTVRLSGGGSVDDGEYKAADSKDVFIIASGKIEDIQQPVLIEAKGVQDAIGAVATTFNKNLEETNGMLIEALEIVKAQAVSIKALQEEMKATKAGMVSNYKIPKKPVFEGDDLEIKPAATKEERQAITLKEYKAAHQNGQKK